MSRCPLMHGLLLAVGVVLGCGSERQLTLRLDGVTHRLQEARAADAARCAPRALAIAEASLEFARIELRQGSEARAREHLRDADENAGAAMRAAQSGACARVAGEQPVALSSVAPRIRSVRQRLLLDGGPLW